MDNNKPQLIDLWRTSFDDSEEFIKLLLRPGLQKRERPVHKERRKDRFRPSNASLPHEFLRETGSYFLYIRRLHSSGLRNRGVMRQLYHKLCPNATERDLLQYTDTGKSVAIRLLCTHRICSGVSIFYERNHSSGVLFLPKK